MYIQWLGQSAIKIQGKDVVVSVDPYENDGIKRTKFASDITLVTNPDKGDLAVRDDSFFITNPGEYEVKGVFIYGVSGNTESATNTMYSIELEGITIAHLGDISTDTLTEEQLERIEGVDVLCVPVGKKDQLDVKEAVALVNQIQPRIVIPIHYAIKEVKEKLESVDSFIKELGVTPEKTDKLKLVKKDLPQEELKVIILDKS